MNFNEELEKLMQTKIQLISKLKSIETELKNSKEQEILQHNDKMDAYHKLIESYSYFDSKKIGNIIASLITALEEKEYVYQECLCCPHFGTDYYIRIIIDKENKRDYYGSIISGWKVICLSSCKVDTNSASSWSSIGTQIPFYCANTTTHFLDTCVEFGDFYYVKAFIDELISYKMEHNLKEIPSKELRKLIGSFISSRIEQIELTKKDELLRQQQEELRQKAGEYERGQRLLLQRVHSPALKKPHSFKPPILKDIDPIMYNVLHY